jgi:hypothetical protein
LHGRFRAKRPGLSHIGNSVRRPAHLLHIGDQLEFTAANAAQTVAKPLPRRTLRRPPQEESASCGLHDDYNSFLHISARLSGPPTNPQPAGRQAN